MNRATSYWAHFQTTYVSTWSQEAGGHVTIVLPAGTHAPDEGRSEKSKNTVSPAPNIEYFVKDASSTVTPHQRPLDDQNDFLVGSF